MKKILPSLKIILFNGILQVPRVIVKINPFSLFLWKYLRTLKLEKYPWDCNGLQQSVD
jgi:hypothetical protein